MFVCLLLDGVERERKRKINARRWRIVFPGCQRQLMRHGGNTNASWPLEYHAPPSTIAAHVIGVAGVRFNRSERRMRIALAAANVKGEPFLSLT